MPPHSRSRRLAVLGALCAIVLATSIHSASIAAPGANSGPKSMVALGDSYASGPLVPVQYEQPFGCLRSSNNYAHQVARQLDLALVDVTCSGASTKHMWETHGVSPEQEFNEYGSPVGDTGHPGNPPQLDALSPTTDIVTLQIGGNDIGFAGLAMTCGEGALRGTGCRKSVEAERPFERIAATAPKIAAVLDEIHRRSPKAKVHVLGYSAIFKIGSTARCEAMGVGEEDARYLRSIHETLNAMIESVADASERTYSEAAGYVDVYGPSAGHTACDLPAIRWIEPIVPVNAAAPVHPNLGGMTAIRDILVDEVWPKGLPQRSSLPGLPAPPNSPI
ncbi:MAG TPA: SGNH/GDSL hydrolase family protein [Acidimicrobiales bacterium]|nr:SGNH/GDSL hydrolase family protein [Acidimicrobiales bacterium]